MNVTFPSGDTATVQIGDSGSFTLDSPPGVTQPDGNLVVSLTDVNGNPAAEDVEIFVDLTPPEVPTIDDLPDIISATPTLTGTAEVGATVIIYDNGAEIGRVTATDGTWLFTPDPALENGEHRLSVEAVDEAGNVSECTEQLIEVDTTAPTQTTSVTYMNKDTGFSHTDMQTNDGSAGRLMQGTLSAVLREHETLQVSTDGGSTWGNAMVNGLDWAAQDLNSHDASCVIQTRVVDIFGREGATSSTFVTLDTNAPAAPSRVTSASDPFSVIVEGLNNANISVGDRVLLQADTNYVEYVITAEDKMNGQVRVLTGGGGEFWAASVKIADEYGNVSATVRTPLKTTTFYSSFEEKGDVVGSKLLNFGTLTASEGFAALGGEFGNAKTGDGFYFGSATNTCGWAQFDLMRPAKSVLLGQMNSISTAGGVKVEFYDTDGNLRQTMSAPGGEASWSPSYDTGGVGAPIASVKLIVANEPGGFYLMSTSISFLGLPSPIVHDVNQSFSYEGGATPDTFLVKNAALLDSFTGSINGNGGFDILKLQGSSQVFDLSALGNTMSSVEVIDITGSGNNTLKLSLGDVLSQGGMDLLRANGDVQMVVCGDAGDIVILDDVLPNGMTPGKWTSGDTVDVAGVMYTSYQYSTMDAELLIQQGVSVTLV